MTIHDNNERSGKVILKIDFKNAFNSISPNKFLSLIHERYPGLYPYTHAAYDSASHLFIGDSALSSDEGGQQGDPEAPPNFCDTVNEFTHKVESELNLWYLDDGNLGGDYAIVLPDFRMIISESAKLGLEVRPDKCEQYFSGNSSETQKSLILSEFNKISPLIETPGIDNLIILGAPVGNLAISNVLSSVGSSSRLCSEILNKPFSDPLYEGALSQGYELSGSTTIHENNFQKSWSDPVYRTRLNNLITDTPENKFRIRLKSFEGKLQ